MAKIRKHAPSTKWFEFFNANPKDNRTADCTIRAISTFLDKSWEDTYRELFEFGLEHCLMIDDPACYKKYLKSLGYEMQKQPRKTRDNTKFTGKEFCDKIAMKDTKYLAHIGGHHIVCIMNNKVYDTWDSTDGSIGNFWVKF